MDKSLILNEIKNHLGFKKDSDFANFLGIKQNTLSTWKSRNVIDYDLIVAKCDNIDANWLLTGKGSMLKEPAQPLASSSQPQENDKYTALLEENISNLKKINALQEEKIKGLEKEVAQLKRDLELYIANSSGDILKSNAG